MCGRAAQGVGSGAPAKLHARRVNDEASFQPAARSDRRVANRDAADLVALVLDGLAAFAANCSRDAAAELEVVVGGVDDGIHIHLGQVAFLDHDLVGDAHIDPDDSRGGPAVEKAAYSLPSAALASGYSKTPRPDLRPSRPALTYWRSSGAGRYFSPRVLCRY